MCQKKNVMKTIEYGWNYRTERKSIVPFENTDYTGKLTCHSVAFLSRQDKTIHGCLLLYSPLDWLPDGGGFAQGQTVGL